METIPVTVAIRSLLSESHRGSVRTKRMTRATGRADGPAHGGDRPELGGDGPHLASGLPGGHRLVVDPAPVAPRLEQQADHDDHEQHREHVEVAPGVEHDRLLDDPQPDGRRRDAREVVHVAQHDGRQRADQHRDRQRAADREAGHARSEEDGDEGEHRGDHPHDGLDPSHRDPEGGGPVGALGDRSHRDADPRVPDEERQGAEHQRHDDEHHQVVVVEEDAADLDLDVERRVQLRPTDVLEPEPAAA